jgi:hypothetical protein
MRKTVDQYESTILMEVLENELKMEIEALWPGC